MKTLDNLHFLGTGLSSSHAKSGYQVEDGWRREDRTGYRSQELPPRKLKRYKLTPVQSETSKAIRDISNFAWDDDLQPSAETVDRASRIWVNHCEASEVVHGDRPTVTAADDNSVDIFWGYQKRRLLVNVPATASEKVLAHFIDQEGETIIYFTDGHSFNIGHLLKELWRSLD